MLIGDMFLLFLFVLDVVVAVMTLLSTSLDHQSPNRNASVEHMLSRLLCVRLMCFPSLSVIRVGSFYSCWIDHFSAVVMAAKFHWAK